MNSLALQSLKNNVLVILSIATSLGFVESFFMRGADGYYR